MKKFIKSFIGDTSLVILSWHRCKAFIAALRYGFPARFLTVIGITGTDGKTTTVAMTAHILNVCEYKTGALSTAFFQVGHEIRWNATQKTSPSPFIIQRFLRELVKAGCTHAVIECSSHGLLQGRVNYTWPMVGAVTNIAEEHLDYHKTMEAYIDAKGLLFRMLRKKSGVKALNADDRSYGQFLKIQTPWTIHCSSRRSFDQPTQQTECGLWMTNQTSTTEKISAVLHGNINQESLEVALPMSGTYNLKNALTAIACAHAVNVPLESAVQALMTFQGVSGRMERITAGQDFSVFIDFTVTPQSYKTTLESLRATLSDGQRLLVLTGSCGDRMREKRPVVGAICAELADVVVITNEDPYTEDPEKIIDEVLAGIPPSMRIYDGTDSVQVGESPLQKACIRISDRRSAIAFILREARTGDVVLLCGKGSDVTMMTADGQIPWVERDIVRKELGAMPTTQ